MSTTCCYPALGRNRRNNTQHPDHAALLCGRVGCCHKRKPCACLSSLSVYYTLPCYILFLYHATLRVLSRIFRGAGPILRSHRLYLAIDEAAARKLSPDHEAPRSLPNPALRGFRLASDFSEPFFQRAQNPLMKEYTLNRNIKAPII